ncbi:MAG: zinc ribbon domain-containing protein [Alphaproteobacteria bacterium]|nr:zinc ribbon domain-containing protein [Alphaproteobacteria bacterium]
MALIKCPECGTKHSDKARVCPKCGYRNYNGLIMVMVFVLLMNILVFLFVGL